MFRFIFLFTVLVSSFNVNAANYYISVQDYAKASIKVEFERPLKVITVAYKLSGEDSLKGAINIASAISDELISGYEPSGYNQVRRTIDTKTQENNDFFVFIATEYRSEPPAIRLASSMTDILMKLHQQKVEVVASVLDNSFVF